MTRGAGGFLPDSVVAGNGWLRSTLLCLALAGCGQEQRPIARQLAPIAATPGSDAAPVTSTAPPTGGEVAPRNAAAPSSGQAPRTLAPTGPPPDKGVSPPPAASEPSPTAGEQPLVPTPVAPPTSEKAPAVQPVPQPAGAERKLHITVTPQAAPQLRTRVLGGHPVARLFVTPNFEYEMEAEHEPPTPEDYVCQTQGITFIADRDSAARTPAGLEIDFQQGFVFGVKDPWNQPPDRSQTLAEARRGFKSRLEKRPPTRLAAPEPPPGLFKRVQYESPRGQLVAYVTPDPQDRQRRPAVIWIAGGDSSTINAECWNEGGKLTDQSAAAYRRAGLVMMCPSLRGGNDNPGAREGFLGEVDDVLAAAEFLRKQRYVDPRRIYLGGHSTGATLALLTAECSDQFRAVFCFGPASGVGGYGPKRCPFFLSDPRELELRAPIRWLHSIRSPVFVFEGAGAPGTHAALQQMAAAAQNPLVQFFSAPGADHFSLLGPTNLVIVDKILRDTGAKCNIAFTGTEPGVALRAVK